MGVCHSEMFTSQVKKEEETGSSLTPALSHGGAASVHTGYFKTFSPQDDSSSLNVHWVFWVQTKHTSPQQTGGSDYATTHLVNQRDRT